MPASWNTTLVADGSYDLRVIVTDHAGNSTTSAIVAARTIDNSAPSLTVTSPADGTYVNSATADPLTISATSTDAAAASPPSRSPQCSDASVDCATGVWSSLGTVTTPPYSASWTLPADGNRTLRIVSTDSVGRATTVVRNVTVDRTAPAAAADRPGRRPPRHGFADARPRPTPAARASTPSASSTRLPARRPGRRSRPTRPPPYAASVDTTGAHRRLLRLPGLRHRRRRQHADRPGLRPPRRQHRPDRHADQPRRERPRHRCPHLQRRRLRLRCRPPSPTSTRRRARTTWQSTSALWNTTSLADGLYDLRATATDNAGNSAPSATRSPSVRVDNTRPASPWAIRARTCADRQR